MNDYKQAALDRVSNTPELAAHKAIILTAHFFTLDEHYQWVATAPVQEIAEWATETEEDEKQYADEPPTQEEQEEEARYYAYLESQMAKAVVVVDPVNFCDDDYGYCGPTCGRFGNW